METNTQKIIDDIYQIRLPLPFVLNHVNCYLLRGDNGWTILDTGLNIPPIQAGWQSALAELKIGPADIEQILVTHSHPDHYGLAGWFEAWCDAPVLMSPREAELARQVWQADDTVGAVLNFLGLAGVPNDTARDAIEGTRWLRKLTAPHPRNIKLLEAGTVLPIGRRRFVALHAPGHSDGQLLFYDAADQLLLSGDQVLIKITPNIGLWPVSEPDPLGRYLASLQELTALDVRLALPGHGPLITNWRGRLAELQQHHADRLDKMLAAVNGVGVTSYDVSRHIFSDRALTAQEIRFAVSETLAHLEYLVDQKRLRRDENGVWLYHCP